MKFQTGLVVLSIISSALFACYGKTADTGNKLLSSSSEEAFGDIKILQVWELPDELKEISSNVLLDENRMACIQDNDGIIYIYNLETKKLENKIPFAEKADYEGLTVVGKTYYVLRSDGFLYEVLLADSGNPQVKTYDLPLDANNDTEPLFYDKPNDRLLIGVKEKDPSGGNKKGIYSFDLNKKVMNTEAVFSINTDLETDGKKKGKKVSSVKPSEIAINDKTNELYILNGPASQLIIADEKGNIKSTIKLGKDVFPQPEGMCFSPSGTLYISSEGGKKGKGVIAKVEL